MPSDLPFQYFPRVNEVLPKLTSGDPKDFSDAVRTLEDRDRALEEYLRNLPTGGGAGGIGAVFAGNTGNISETLGAFAFDEWPAYDMDCNEGDTFFLSSQCLLQTPSGSIKADVIITADGATVTTFGDSHNELGSVLQLSPTTTGIATATSTHVAFNIALVTYDYGAKFITGNIHGIRFVAETP